jgi:hypothetical protein
MHNTYSICAPAPLSEVRLYGLSPRLLIILSNMLETGGT